MKAKSAWQKVEDFFLEPASARPLAALRIGLVAVLLVQAFLLRGSVIEFFAHDGLVQGDLAQFLSNPGTPRIGWFLGPLSHLGFDETQVIWLTCFAYVASLVFLGLGFLTRAASIAAWLLHWTLMNTGYTTAYGVDLYAHVFLFYLMWAPSGDAFSLDVMLGRRDSRPSTPARLALRVMQIHLCITYLCSGIEKASGVQWWNGELLWRAFQLPVYAQFDMSWLVNFPWLSKVAGWTTLVFELGYCVFIWPKATRRFWVAAITSLHLGIALFLGLGVFGSVMCVMTLALFGVSSGVRAWKGEVGKPERAPEATPLLFVPSARRGEVVA